MVCRASLKKIKEAEQVEKKRRSNRLKISTLIRYSNCLEAILKKQEKMRRS